MSRILKETNHDYGNCLVDNWFSEESNHAFNSWEEFKSIHTSFAKNDPLFERYDDKYHLVFRYDIHKQDDNEKYDLELCMMLQRKGIYCHLLIKNISEEELNGDIKIWLKGRLKYLKTLWTEVDIDD